MQMIGYVLLDKDNQEIQQYLSLPNEIKLNDGSILCGFKVSETFSDGSKVLPVFSIDESPGQFYQRLRLEKQILDDKILITTVYSEEPDIEMKRSLTVVTPLQFRKALNQLNIRTLIEDYVKTLDDDSRDAWEYATVFERNNPTIISAAEALNKTPEEIDDLFQLASTL